MTSPNIAIIGAGNMGSSLLGGLLKNNYSANHIWISDADQQKLDHLHQQFNIHTTADNKEAIKNADIIILAVKPQILKNVTTDIAPQIQAKKPLILSIAAGIPIASLQHWLGTTMPIVRAMPNTPALIGCGATALFANEHVSSTQHNLSESIMRAVGITVWIEDEKLMDAVTALSGSGPAYFFLIIEALENAAMQLGLPKDIANLLTVQTAYGAARMALESHDTVEKLRHNVTSPGGTTEQGVRVLEESNIRNILLHTLQAADHRSKELAELLGNTKEK